MSSFFVLSVRKGNVQRAPDDYSGFPCAKHSDEPPQKQEACSPEGSTLPGVSSP